jgi:beta-mannosidase
MTRLPWTGSSMSSPRCFPAGWAMVLATMATATHGLLIQELTGLRYGAEWHVTNGNGSVAAKASVPGHVHLDLLAAGLIKDPYYRFEDRAQQWVALDSWTYSTSFSVDPCLVAHNRTVVLALEGVDTAADVVLNGHHLASVANQHVRFSLPLRGAPITAGANTLQVRFQSAVTYAAEQRASYPADIKVYGPPWASTENKTFVRKQQCDFGWDWGPALTSVGIWRPMSLISYRIARLTGATSSAELHRDAKHWRVKVKIFLEYAPAETARTVSLVVSLQAIASSTVAVTLPAHVACAAAGDTPQLQELTASAVLLVPVHAVDRWWPNGHGKQPLYNLSVTLTEGGGQAGSGRQARSIEGHSAPCSDSIDVVSRRVGFRTAELVRHADSDGIKYGSTFFLRVNGRPIFAKGSSWVPADAFDSRVSREVLRRLLGSVVEVR